MKVFHVICAQGPGFHAICKTLEVAKRHLQQIIIDYQEQKYPGSKNDPDPWAGWSWWEKDGVICFGGESQQCIEGSIKEMEVIE